MEGDLADVNLALSAALTWLGVDETFDGVGFWERGLGVNGAVDNTVAADAYDLDEFEGSVVDECAQWGVRGAWKRLWWHREG